MLLILTILLLFLVICVTNTNSSTLSMWSASGDGSFRHMVKCITLVIIAALLWEVVMQNSCLFNSKDPSCYGTTGVVSLFDNLWLIVFITGINLHFSKHIRCNLLDVILPHIILDSFLLNEHVGGLFPIWLPPKKDVNWVHTK